ncbi:MAG: FprA family A-type flavoprotein [Synergistaceae bacterium]|jgi:flavorubredoxin|nr:FprA family A-type flavoprotein [Synergistaceae bacterium]
MAFKTYGTLPVTDSVSWIGANDRETDKFEGLWDIPLGVAYNSYFINDDKTALIDTVKSSFMDDFIYRLGRLLGERQLDYVIVNHVEPDHSGSLGLIRRLYPGVRFVGNAKTLDLIKNFYHIDDGFVEVGEGEVLDLGLHKLSFAFAPMVHWPESMATYDATEKILFSNDVFGGFGALEGGLFDDEVNLDWALYEMMRYYVNIVGRFAAPALKALAKIRALDIGMICPAHGPIWRSDPSRVMGLYEKWSRQETEEGVVLVYGSMYGNTKAASDLIARSLTESGVNNVSVYDISRSNMSYITTDIWRYAGLILSCCTYNMELFPPMAALLRLLENKMMKGRQIGLCGTYSWSGAALKEMKAFVERSKGNWNLLDPAIEIKSYPTETDIELCAALGQEMARAVKRGL